ncbi:hypothetical protein [Cellulomonas sp.]|uniref:hypothetical protein n=1 Tax=Cellulomonas sp. TaxID=40001 RepID=UPI003BAA3880
MLTTRTPHRPARRPAPPAGARRVVETLVAVVGLLGLGSGAAWAWWSVSADATTAVSAVTVAPPTTVTCTADSRLFFEDTVTIRWAAPVAATPPGSTRSYTVTFVSTSGTIVKTVPDGTLQLLVRWTDINANSGWNQKQTITVRASAAFPSTTWVSAPANPVASTGSTTLGYNNLACATP